MYSLLIPTAFAESNTKINTLIENVTDTMQLLVTLMFVVALLIFAWGIVQMIVAAGQGPEALRKAKGFLLWGIIGMAVLASIGGIIFFLRDFVGVENDTSISVPQFTTQ